MRALPYACLVACVGSVGATEHTAASEHGAGTGGVVQFYECRIRLMSNYYTRNTVDCDLLFSILRNRSSFACECRDIAVNLNVIALYCIKFTCARSIHSSATVLFIVRVLQYR